MGASRFSLSFSVVSLSSRRSSLVPTKMMGVFGQWWLTSGYHCRGRGATIRVHVHNSKVHEGSSYIQSHIIISHSVHVHNNII